MKQPKLMAAFLIGLLLVSTAAFANCKCVDKVTSDNYGVRAPSRLLHGIINAGLGWTEIFTEPFNTVRDKGGSQIVEGIFTGLGMAAYYSALGAWDIATFWVPGSGGKDIAVKTCVLMKE